ncbi:hypothetical protein GCM10027176_20560 [Actinoallomurus bryophytorum]|uniref:Carboxypeptidase family protein n=1 Tax=Actinoallomurus bryophytorum TaxID=1490222 RepID=A0A543CL97_9ACTN|nr:hypothetical protein [Actinoallomurus bryophytorum]TQL97667.1 hypothetical protein FB559_3266 [Actinoallomurus bryophytorum]
MFRALGAVLAAGLILAAAQVPATADTRAPARFSEFSVTPTSLDVDHPTATYTGRLVFTGADGTDQGVPGARVCLDKDGRCVATTETDADGRFSSPVTLSSTGAQPQLRDGEAEAFFNGDAERQSTFVGSGIALHVTQVQARITMGFDHTPSVVGDPVEVSGLLERQTPDGGWIGVVGQTVRVFVDGTRIAEGTTAADGTYRISTRVPVSDEGFWGVETPLPGRGYPYTVAFANTWQRAAHRTLVTGFNAAPEPVRKGAKLTATGRVMRVTADGSTEPATDYPVLQFSADGKKWTDLYEDHPNSQGYFSLSTPAERDGYWRVRTEDWPDLPSTSSVDYVDVGYRTAISGFNASPEPIAKGRRLTVAGTLKRDTTAWKAFSGQSVKIYFAAKGATSWTYEGTAKTSSTGHFSHTFTAAKDGTWRAIYAGSTTYVTVTGPGDYVDVR